MKILIGTIIALFSLPTLASDIEGSAVLLRGVDKVTGRTAVSEVPVNTPTTIGNLRITVERCLKKPPEEIPENAAFLLIEEKQNDVLLPVFNGWMFSSNPAISAMEHPVFDIWVLDCLVPEPVIDEELPLPNLEEPSSDEPGEEVHENEITH